MKKVLITGAAGFLGSYLLRHYAATHELYALVRPDQSGKLPQSVTPVLLDLSKDFSAKELPADMDTVVYLAQSPHYREFPEKAAHMFAVNVNGVLKLLEYGRQTKIRQFILASSGSVYAASNRPITESTPPEPGNFYASTKLISEQVAAQYGQYFKTACLRFFFMYGEGQQKMMIPGLIDRLKNDRAITLSGERGLRFNPIHVSDAAKIISEIIDKNISGTFNVAGPQVTDIRQLAELLAEGLNTKAQFDIREAAEAHFVASIDKLKARLQIAPLIPPAEGIRRTLGTQSPSLSN